MLRKKALAFALAFALVLPMAYVPTTSYAYNDVTRAELDKVAEIVNISDITDEFVNKYKNRIELYLSAPKNKEIKNIEKLESFQNLRNLRIESNNLREDVLKKLIFKLSNLSTIEISTNKFVDLGSIFNETREFEKKKKMIELSLKYDFYIIEDECFSDFFYNSKECPKSLKALDKYERVFFIKTFSKIVMPALALTMLIPPKKYIDSFSLNKYFIDTTTSGINQKFLEIFIKRGLLENHLEKLRLNLKMKMEYIINELQKIKHLEIMHIPKGGFFIWVNLANYINSEKFYYKCRLRGLSVLPGFIFYSTSEETTSKIRISIVSSSMKEMKKGLEIIQDVLNSCDFKLK